MGYIIDVVWLLVSGLAVTFYGKELIHCIEDRPLSKVTITFALLIAMISFVKIFMYYLNQIIS